MKPLQQYARVSEVVEMFGLSADWWRARADQGDVEVQRINNQRIFNVESCARLLKYGKPEKPVGSPRALIRSVTSDWRRGVMGDRERVG